ncbi:MAG: hypothetical protein QM723_15005 [Myxococcaceae bacterium]
MRLALAVLLACALGGCRDWDGLSDHFDGGDGGQGGGAAVGGGSATGGGGDATGGGSATGGGGSATGGGGSATGGGVGGGGANTCTSTGSSAACPSNALYCDNFNDATLRDAWANEQVNGTIAPSADCVFQGGRALRSQLNAVAATVAAHATVSEADSGTPLPGTQFLRAMIRLQSPAPGPAVKLIGVHQGEPGTGAVAMSYEGGNLSLSATGGTITNATVPFPLDTWVCVEWQLDEGSPGVTKVWLDGGSTTAIEGSFTVTQLKTITLGAQLGDHGDPASATDLYFDELVVAPTRVGCP